MAKKVTLLGLGGILMRDEGAGVHAVRFIKEHYEIPPGLEIVDGGTSGLDLLAFIENRDRVLVVDAVNFGKHPGYIGVLNNQEIPVHFGCKDSLHHLGLMDVLAAAQLLDAAPKETCLIGIQPSSIEMGLELSGIIQAKLGELVDQVITRLRDWGLTVRPLPAKREG
jgi:hydrogenase maturation protease